MHAEDDVVYWNTSVLMDDGGNGIYRLEWNLTKGKILFINEKKECTWEFVQTDLRKVDCYYSMARNVMATMNFHVMLKDFTVMFENETCIDDFIKQAKAILGDPENHFKYISETSK